MIASLTSLTKVLAFHPYKDVQTRVDQLLEKNKEQGLTDQEKDELEHYYLSHVCYSV